MKEYIFKVVDSYTVNCWVQADSLEEAERKAKHADLYRGDFKFVGRTCELIEEKEN